MSYQKTSYEKCGPGCQMSQGHKIGSGVTCQRPGRNTGPTGTNLGDAGKPDVSTFVPPVPKTGEKSKERIKQEKEEARFLKEKARKERAEEIKKNKEEREANKLKKEKEKAQKEEQKTKEAEVREALKIKQNKKRAKQSRKQRERNRASRFRSRYQGKAVNFFLNIWDSLRRRR